MQSSLVYRRVVYCSAVDKGISEVTAEREIVTAWAVTDQNCEMTQEKQSAVYHRLKFFLVLSLIFVYFRPNRKLNAKNKVNPNKIS